MASTLIAPQSGKIIHFSGRKSIEALLTSLRDSNFQISANFVSEFQEFVQSKSDPPLESIWVYAALTFNPKESEPFSRVSGMRDLFQLIVSCSVSCNSIKSIALVAPVIYIVHEFILDLKTFELGPKKERKLNGEIKSLVESVLGYVNVCCNAFDQNFGEFEGMIWPLGDLVSCWTAGDDDHAMKAETLRAFFPLLSDDIVNGLSIEGCEVTDLAGFVVAEAFLLQLCWKLREEGFEEKGQNDIKYWIVGSITGLCSSYFYGSCYFIMLLMDCYLKFNSTTFFFIISCSVLSWKKRVQFGKILN